MPPSLSCRSFSPLLLALLLATPLHAWAWGDTGHQVVGLIAQKHLLPQARTRIEALLATDDSHLTPETSIVSEATWADRYRDSSAEHKALTFDWHFVDIEIGSPASAASLAAACFGYPALPAGTPASAGVAKDCVTHKLEQFIGELKDPATDHAEHLRALQFVLHFTGDVHQPLHASDDHDSGGNDKLAFIDHGDPVPLHRHWDSGFVAMLGASPAEIAESLDAGITRAEITGWLNTTPQDWALEAFAISKADVYGRLPAASGTSNGKRLYELSPAYVQQAVADTRLQLARAGIRLAAVLNAAFAGGGDTPQNFPAALSRPRQPKVMLITLFGPEAEYWEKNLGFTDSIRVAGLSEQYPAVRCTADEVCLITTGMGHSNAAASIMALAFSNRFDLRHTYFILTGIAGIDPHVGTIGSAAWARYLVDFGLAHEIDAREMPKGWKAGYFGIQTKGPDIKPKFDYGTEVFQLNEKFLQQALRLSQGAALADNATAQAYRKHYPQAAARTLPGVIQCDTAAGDTYWHGAKLGEWATRWVGLLTDGKGRYCTTQQEDNAVYEALKRGAAAGRVDLARIAVLRTGANFDRPYPGQSAYASLVESHSGGFDPARENLYRAGWPVVREITTHWPQWQTGVPELAP